MSETKKVVINACYGGFSLSARAVKRLAELQGRECYFFAHPEKPLDIHKYESVSVDEAERRFMFHSFDIPNPERLRADSDRWAEMSVEERGAHNEEYKKHAISDHEQVRHDPLLVRVVEELGGLANGKHANLRIVEIPTDVEYEIEEYDGNEHVAEVHRTWS